MVNTKLSKQRFWHCHENGLIKTIPTIPHNLYMSLHIRSAHNAPIYGECQTQSAKVLTLPWERAHQDISNDTPQLICECQVDFPLLWIKDYPNPQQREVNLTLTCRLWGIVWIILMSPFSWQCQNLCSLSLAFIKDWRIVTFFLKSSIGKGSCKQTGPAQIGSVHPPPSFLHHQAITRTIKNRRYQEVVRMPQYSLSSFR